jgi:hypothetical protein
MSPPRDDGALIITFPRAWTAAKRLEFMADVARALPRERWAHVGPPAPAHSRPFR